MKNLLSILAVMAIAVVSQAATVKWSIGGSATYVMNDYLGNPYANQKVYLINANDVSSLTNPTQDKDTFLSNLANLTIFEATSASDGTKPTTVNNLEVSSSTLMEADTQMTFDALVFSEDSEFGYYKLMTVNATPYADTAPATARTANVRTAWNTIGGKSWTKAYAVPEPSTAMLALAGLALLLKRRRA